MGKKLKLSALWYVTKGILVILSAVSDLFNTNEKTKSLIVKSETSGIELLLPQIKIKSFHFFNFIFLVFMKEREKKKEEGRKQSIT